MADNDGKIDWTGALIHFSTGSRSPDPLSPTELRLMREQAERSSNLPDIDMDYPQTDEEKASIRERFRRYYREHGPLNDNYDN